MRGMVFGTLKNSKSICQTQTTVHQPFTPKWPFRKKPCQCMSARREGENHVSLVPNCLCVSSLKRLVVKKTQMYYNIIIIPQIFFLGSSRSFLLPGCWAPCDLNHQSYSCWSPSSRVGHVNHCYSFQTYVYCIHIHVYMLYM